MFLLRSAFWLTVMFLVIAPRDYDLGKDVANASQGALEAGQYCEQHSWQAELQHNLLGARRPVAACPFPNPGDLIQQYAPYM